MATPRARGHGGRRERSRGGRNLGGSAPDQRERPPRGKCQTKSSGHLRYKACHSYNNSSTSEAGSSHKLSEVEPNLCCVPLDLVHTTVSGQALDANSERSPGTSRSSHRQGGKPVSQGAPGRGFLSIGHMRIYCEVDCDSDHSSSELHEVESEVDAFMIQQGLFADLGSGMGQDEAEDSDTSCSNSYDSSACLTGSSVEHDLAEDYISNIGHDSCGGLLLSKDLLDHIPVEYMRHLVNVKSPIQNRASVFGESSGTGEPKYYPTCPDFLQTTLRFKDLDINSSVPPPDPGDYSVAACTWPVCTVKCRKKKLPAAPCLKKQVRKQRIEVIRNQRATKRGFDLCAVNLVMENIVRKEVDMHCLEPMEKRDREQVIKLASMYGLKSGSQGRGKKRFVVVTRTRHSSIPSGVSRDRLLELLASSQVPSSNQGIDRPTRTRAKSRYKDSYWQLQDRTKQEPSRLHRSRNSQSSGKSMAMQPLSFVSSGVMETTGVATMDIVAPFSSAAPTPLFGSFECHTKGFGSRIMAKMGFVEGAGLGKDGKGIAHPIEPIKRPKSLGLGAAT